MPNKNLFIAKANVIHNNKYCYSEVEYVNNKTNIKIMCPIHGMYLTTPERHLINVGCPICSGYKMNTNSFIDKANIVHGNNYDYSLVEYVNNKLKIKIICSLHGIFEQTSTMHLNGQGCPKCAIVTNSNKRKYNSNDFINKATLKHGNKYDYSLVNYTHSRIKVKIICPIHGVFEQNPSLHILGNNCPKCSLIKANDSKRMTTDVFINKANLIHGGKYDYSNVKYVGSNNKIIILCSKHGKFEQNPSNHLMGQGCPICNESKGESKIMKILTNNNIDFSFQKTFNDCKGNVHKLPFDFYLPKFGVVIEYNGLQHYEPIKYFGGLKTFNRILRCDEIKRNYLNENNIKLITIKFLDFDNINTILINEKIIK